MNPICEFCTMQEVGDKVRCCAAFYINNHYGSHKHGCKCIYDKDLSVLFKARTGAEISISNMVIKLKKQEDDLSKMRDENSELKRRLITINS